MYDLGRSLRSFKTLMWQKYEVMKLYDEFYAVNHSDTYLFLFPILMPQMSIKSAFLIIWYDFNSISYSRATCARWKNLPQYKNVRRKYFFFFTFFKKIYLKCETIYDFFNSNAQFYSHWGLRKRKLRPRPPPWPCSQHPLFVLKTNIIYCLKMPRCSEK